MTLVKKGRGRPKKDKEQVLLEAKKQKVQEKTLKTKRTVNSLALKMGKSLDKALSKPIEEEK